MQSDINYIYRMRFKRNQSGRIAIALLPDERGHINAATNLAQRLIAVGFDVVFVGLADDRAVIEELGYEYMSIAEELYPKGKWAAEKREREEARFGFQRLVKTIKLMRKLNDFLSAFAKDISGKFDLIISDGLLYYGPLVASKANIPVVLLQTSLPFDNPVSPPLGSALVPKLDGTLSLRSRWRNTAVGRLLSCKFGMLANRVLGIVLKRFLIGSNLSEMKRFGLSSEFFPRPLRDFRSNYLSIVACPRAFDYNIPELPETFYVDALIDPEEDIGSLDWTGIPVDKRIVYASMGSQTWMLKDGGKAFYNKILETFQDKSDSFLILSAGPLAKSLEREWKLPNIRILDWAPQKDILRRADLMITHGGLNSIKECVHFEVPMICFPIGRDQPGNAARIKFHRLGLVGNVERSSVAQIRKMIREIELNPIYRIRLNRMKRCFDEAAQRNEVVEIISTAVGKSCERSEQCQTSKQFAIKETV